ncbi:hypothetical protein B296_00009787 [Ensete ventricosum]|uniref:Uncharacterized protein n=1 Tax=Ensete ventricosum TaxID=4639 RepID=A0A426YFP6_ENSVE|nr:hypothetical protein B296_00009787 [Ensete ventricosum]
MLPLRFPNGGIRAKVVRAKLSFKLHVMRLHHIELFYAFLLCFHCEHSKEGRLAMAKPPSRVVDHGQAPYGEQQPTIGDWATRGQGQLQRDARGAVAHSPGCR